MALKHASCVELNGKGILIFGASGSGKSDLALRIMDAGGKLVSDDYVELSEKSQQIVATTAPNIEGMIEVRGVGLMQVEYKAQTVLALALVLTEREKIERLPETEYFEYGTAKVPLYKFDPFSLSAISKIKMLIK